MSGEAIGRRIEVVCPQVDISKELVSLKCQVVTELI